MNLKPYFLCSIPLVFLQHSIIILFVLIVTTEAVEEYTLFNVMREKFSTLIDKNGDVVHEWPSEYTVGYVAYMTQNGVIYRACSDPDGQMNGGGSAGIVQKVDWDGTVLWEYTYSTSDVRTHHDIEVMPNGNVLLIAWETKSAAEAIQAGRVSASRDLWMDHIIEVKQTGPKTGEIVWEWHFWDHLIQDVDDTKDNYGVVKDHPELLDINYGASSSSDWIHSNGIDYNEKLDQIVISSHTLDEFYVIDHSTTTEEAKGHSGGKRKKGGDILYRWGNPEAYGRGTSSSYTFDVLHDASWIPDGLNDGGKFMMFNNGTKSQASSIDIIDAPVDNDGNYTINATEAFGPAEPCWSYNKSGFYSNHLGSAERLPNGNTLICEATEGYFFEIDPQKNEVWNYSIGSMGQAPQCHRYTEDNVGIKEKISSEKAKTSLYNMPNPFSMSTKIFFDNPQKNARIQIFSLNGKELLNKNVKLNSFVWDATKQPAGVYVLKINVEGKRFSKFLNLIK